MPNWCSYTLEAVAKTKEPLERLLKIMDRKDGEWFIYRVHYVMKTGLSFDEKSGLWVLEADGDVAWSCYSWFCDDEEEYSGWTLENGAKYTTLRNLCRVLGIGVECFGAEEGSGFQERHMADHNGNVTADECVSWTVDDIDDDGNRLDEPIETGGLENYCVFSSPRDIYG